MDEGINRREFIRRGAAGFAGAVVALRGRDSLGAGAERAEGPLIENVTIAPRDARTATVRFDIAWDNSWRDKVSHDAAWVFLKVRADGAAEWQHVRLAADKVLNPTGYGRGEGTPLDHIVPDGDDGFVGLFVRRVAEGKGPLAARGVTAVWDLTANPGIPKDLKGVSLRPFGIQMVYVAEGPFHLGSGGTEINGFYMYTDGSQNIQPYRVTRAGAIPTGRRHGALWAWKGAQPEDGGEIPAAFPNGYGAFYCMKYKVSRTAYADFMNTLTPAQADKHYHPRIVIRSGEAPPYTYVPHKKADRFKWGALGLSWADGAAFAAWAGLRSMTELELEKAVRGPREPVPDEIGGPSYWGVSGFDSWDWHAMKLEMQTERAVTVGNAAGRRFRGTHGRGSLTLPADWPQEDAVGAGMRCSWWGFHRIHHKELARATMSDSPGYHPMAEDGWWELPRTRLSDRLYAALVDPERRPYHQWRGVRTAPKGVGS
jgi:hypothetical protein